MEDEKIALIQKMLNDFSVLFTRRPGMLGTPENIDAMFWLYDQVDFILKYGKALPFAEKSCTWMTFLGEKGYHQGTKNLLPEQLRALEPAEAYKRLQALREEYSVWQAARAEEAR